jgi:hypothetical protein
LAADDVGIPEQLGILYLGFGNLVLSEGFSLLKMSLAIDYLKERRKHRFCFL